MDATKDPPAPTIGHPFCAVQLFVVDSTQQLLPVGCRGELEIAGVGLVQGYLNQPQLTADRFITQSVAPNMNPVRLYRTGDLVRYDPCGRLEYLGRNDKLPGHMLPETIVFLDHIPLSANGKVDTACLRKLHGSQSPSAAVESLSDTEALLADCWRRVLGSEVARVGADDSFFQLGGNSLSVVRLVAEVKAVFGADMSSAEMYAASTLREMATAIVRRAPRNMPPLRPCSTPGTVSSLCSAQEQMWVLEKLYPGRAVYNVPVAVRLEPHVDLTLLQQAFTETVSRQEVLRSRFFESVDAVRVAYDGAVNGLQIVRIVDSCVMSAVLEQLASAPFKIEEGEVARGSVLVRGGERVLAVMTHHIVADGQSVRIFLRELAAHYFCLREKKPYSAPTLALRYADYVHWQRSWVDDTRVAAQLDYWRSELASVANLPLLPSDIPRPPQQTFRGDKISLTIGDEAVAHAAATAKAHNVTLFTVFLSAFQLLLHSYSGQDVVTIGTPVSLRPQELASVMGLMLNTVVLKSHLNETISFAMFLQQTKRQVSDALSNRDVPFAKLVELLKVPRQLDCNPLFQAMFTFEADDAVIPHLGQVVDVPYPVAKFDLTLTVFHSAGRTTAALEFATDLFTAETAQRLLQEYHRLLAALVSATDDPTPAFRSMMKLPIERGVQVVPPILMDVAGHQSLNEIEQQLAAVWRNVLSSRELGDLNGDSNLFSVGGASLSVVRLVAEIKRVFGKTVSFSGIYGASTAQYLTAIDVAAADASTAELVSAARRDRMALSPGQQQMWLLDQLYPHKAIYNVPVAVRLKQHVALHQLQCAFRAVVLKHDVLRSRFAEIDGSVYWSVEQAQPSFRRVLLKQDCAMEDAVSSEAMKPFHLQGGEVVRGTVFIQGVERVLVVVFHHIAVDLASVRIILREVAVLYDCLQPGEQPMPPELQFSDFVIWQAKRLSTERIMLQVAYWKQNLTGIPQLQLLTDFPQPEVPTFRGGSVVSSLAGEVEQASIVAVGTPVSLRIADSKLADMVGFLLNTVVIRSEVHPGQTVSAFLEQTQNIVIAAFEHQDAPFPMVVEAVNSQRSVGRNPLFQAMFVYVEEADLGADVAPLGELADVYCDTAKFDLLLSVHRSPSGTRYRLEFARDLFTDSTAKTMATLYAHMLSMLTSGGDFSVADALCQVDVSLSPTALHTKQKRYWQRRLFGALPASFLPFASPGSSTAVEVCRVELTSAVCEAMAAFCHSAGAQLSSGYLTVFIALLHRYLQSDDLLVGLQLTDSPQLPCRVQLSAGTSLGSLITLVDRSCLEDTRHATTMTRNELLDDGTEESKACWLCFRCESTATSSLKGFQLLLDISEGGGVCLHYHCDSLPHSFATQLVEHYVRLASLLVEDATIPLAAAAVLSEDQIEKQMTVWRGGSEPLATATLHRLFEAQVARTPDATAILQGDASMSYQELNGKANQLAHLLRGKGVGAELVCISVERSFDMLVGILSMKAGGAYVPLDPAYPEERLRFMVHDIRARILLTQAAYADNWKSMEPHFWVIVLGDSEQFAEFATSNIADVAAKPSDLAYVIYTSGTTGRPKGVMVQHGGAASICVESARLQGIEQGTKCLQFCSLNFDVSVWEWAGTLSAGGTLCLRPPGKPWHDAVLEIVSSHDVEVANFTPSALEAFQPDELKSVRTITLAGEKVSEGLKNEDAAAATIGRPMQGVQLFVMDSSKRLLPAGCVGELFIGGIGLARGYLNRPELTAERFILHQFERDASPVRLYRTGERYDLCGRLEYLGRNDTQVKLRGFRVELGEVEAALKSQTGVQSAAVLVVADLLIAYAVPSSGDLTEKFLLQQLSRCLPAHMIPQRIVKVDCIPLTLNGKLDASKLIELYRAEVAASKVLESFRWNAEDTKVRDVWAQVLRVETIDCDSNFFALGGNSLLAVELVRKLNAECGLSLTLAQFYQVPTMDALLARKGRVQTYDPCLLPLSVRAGLPVLVLVHPIGGIATMYSAILPALQDRFSVYGLACPELVLGDEAPHCATLQEVAADYIQRIKTLPGAAAGYHHLGGWSLGGVIALEMARQLQAAGDVVSTLLLVDTMYVPHQGKVPGQQVRLLMEKVTLGYCSPATLAQVCDLSIAQQQMLTADKASPIAPVDQVALIKCLDDPLLLEDQRMHCLQWYLGDDFNGLRHFFAPEQVVHVCCVPCNHFRVFDEEQTDTLNDKLSQLLLFSSQCAYPVAGRQGDVENQLFSARPRFSVQEEPKAAAVLGRHSGWLWIRDWSRLLALVADQSPPYALQLAVALTQRLLILRILLERCSSVDLFGAWVLEDTLTLSLMSIAAALTHPLAHYLSVAYASNGATQVGSAMAAGFCSLVPVQLLSVTAALLVRVVSGAVGFDHGLTQSWQRLAWAHLPAVLPAHLCSVLDTALHVGAYRYQPAGGSCVEAAVTVVILVALSVSDLLDAYALGVALMLGSSARALYLTAAAHRSQLLSLDLEASDMLLLVGQIWQEGLPLACSSLWSFSPYVLLVFLVGSAHTSFDLLGYAVARGAGDVVALFGLSNSAASARLSQEFALSGLYDLAASFTAMGVGMALALCALPVIALVSLSGSQVTLLFIDVSILPPPLQAQFFSGVASLLPYFLALGVLSTLLAHFTEALKALYRFRSMCWTRFTVSMVLGNLAMVLLQQVFSRDSTEALLSVLLVLNGIAATAFCLHWLLLTLAR